MKLVLFSIMSIFLTVGELYSSDIDVSLLEDYLKVEASQANRIFTDEELISIDKSIEILQEKKNHCCYGEDGPTLRCATSLMSRCKRKPNCYWNC